MVSVNVAGWEFWRCHELPESTAIEIGITGALAVVAMTDYSREVTSPMVGHATPRRKRRSGSTSLQFGDYRILGIISRGGTSGVYLGAHVVTQERRALKILDPVWHKHEEIIDRMFAEHQVSSAVSHPGLLEIHSFGRAPDGTPYLVMELLDGENLGELVERGRVVTGAIAAIGAQVAHAVSAMHDRDIVHCDIKPDNVFLLYERGLEGWPRIKVIDFGVSQCADAKVSDAIAGTPSCMAPEQWRGEPTAKSDVYALGCLLYWLVTGAPPFTGPLPQLMLSHTNVLPQRPSEVRELPAELERIIMRALSKDPAMRPTMREIARDLSALAAQYPTGEISQLLEVATG
jgi:eukaryotic-like serine/threonine-protein kinase